MICELVAQPLDGGAGHEDRALQGVLRRLALELPRQRGEEPVLAGDGLGARLVEQKTARPVGVFGLAGLGAALAEQRRVLVARDAGHGDGRAQHLGIGLAKQPGRRAGSRAGPHAARRAAPASRRSSPACGGRRASSGSRSSRRSRGRGRPSGSTGPSCRRSRRPARPPQPGRARRRRGPGARPAWCPRSTGRAPARSAGGRRRRGRRLGAGRRRRRCGGPARRWRCGWAHRSRGPTRPRSRAGS